MDRVTARTPVRGRASAALRPLMILNFVVLALMLSLVAWGVVDGWMFDLSSIGTQNRALVEQLGLLSVFLSLGSVLDSRRSAAAASRRRARPDEWWDRVYSAARLVTTNRDHALRRSGLVMLEQLRDGPSVSVEDRATLCALVDTLKLVVAHSDRA